MEAYQKRVVEERDEMDSKIKKLAFFLAREDVELDDDETVRLYKQLAIMINYSAILLDRISSFEKQVKKEGRDEKRKKSCRGA